MKESFLILHHVGSWDHTQIIRFDTEFPSLLVHPTGPYPVFFKKMELLGSTVSDHVIVFPFQMWIFFYLPNNVMNSVVLLLKERCNMAQ